MTRLSLSDALSKAHYFVILDPYGPYGEWGSFRPLKVEFEESKGKWIVVCTFKKGAKEVKARITIDDEKGVIVGYEELEG